MPPSIGSWRSSAASDLTELRDLADRYGLAFDQRDQEAFDRLWEPAGVLEVFQDGPAQPATGALRVGQFHHAFARLARYRFTQHHVTTHTADVNGSTATGVTYCEAHHVADATDLVMHIRYVDTYRRDPASGWRFAHRRVEVLATEERAVRPLG